MLLQFCCLIVLISIKSLNGLELTRVDNGAGCSNGHEINKGQFIQSPNNQYRFELNFDCDLVKYVC